MNLDRYDERQKEVIKKYFEVLADTRLTGKLSEGIRNREIKYWERFSVPVVITGSIHPYTEVSLCARNIYKGHYAKP